MGPKKGKLERYTTNYSHYKLLTLEENQALAMKNIDRLSQIESTTLLFQDYALKLDEIKKEQEKINEWNNYIACDGLPHSHIPCELRTFLHKISVFEADDFRNSFSWILKIDERSILTQDVDAKNYTRSYLKQNLRRNYAMVYDNFINELLTVCKNVQKTLDTKFNIEKQEQYEDIKMLKIDIQEKVKLMYDMLTFRILSNENSNMETVTVKTAEYNYKSDKFSLDLWTFKNVPITFNIEDMPSIDVLLKTIQVAVTLPFAVLHENLVLRGIYINYDHYSEFSRTSKISSDHIPMEQDLKRQLKKEWKERIAMQKDIKEKMKEERRLFEEYLILKEIEDKEAAKEGKKAEPKNDKKKGKKAPLEPPIVDNNSFPSIDEDFIKFVEKQHIDMQKQFDPELLELDKNEINLREYLPLGGLYELNYVHKNDQVIFSNIIMKWFVQPIKLRYTDKVTDVKMDAEQEILLLDRRSRRFTQIGKHIEERRIVHNFEIVFKIPESVTKWSDPIACHFCLGNDLVDFQKDQQSVNNLSGLSKKLILTTTPIIINDFNISGYLNNEQIYNIIKYALPRTISTYQMPDELIEQKKTGGGGLKKFKTLDEEEGATSNTIDNDNNNMNNKKDLPERLFPNYPKLQPIVILENLNKNLSDEKYFHDLINDFQQYQLIKQPYFIVRDLPTKKLKELIALEIKERAKRLSSKQMVKPAKKKGKRDNMDDNMTNVTNDESYQSLTDTVADQELIEDNGGEATTNEPDLDNINKNKKDEEFVMGSIRANKITDLDDKTQWSTKYILSSHFNRERSELTIITDRLGVFAFMFPKFLHFPYKTWSLNPDPDNPRECVIFYMESKAAKFTIKMTEEGYFVDIRNYGIGVKTLQIYFKNVEPITDLSYLIEEMRIRNLNIFPDADSFIYIKGRSQEKLLPLELHSYNCMAVYSLFLKFSMSEWNWISDPRTLIFKAGELRDKPQDLTLIKVTLEESSFVEIKELCSPDDNNIILEYTPSWRNIEYAADLVSLITTSYTGAYNNRIKDPKMYSYISNLLRAIRPLSCC